MTTGWIIGAVIAVTAILLAIILLTRKRPSGMLPGQPVATAETLLPEQVVLTADAPPAEHATLAEQTQTVLPYPVAQPSVEVAPAPGTGFAPEPHSPPPPVEDWAGDSPTAAVRDGEDAPVPIDLSGALAENDDPAGASPPIPAPIAPEPVSVSTPPAPSAPQPARDGDNLLRLKGVGPKIATLLRDEGITRYAQIAAWGDADIAAIDARLGSFAGRPRRDNWVDQARLLAAGDVAGYEAKYGKL